MLRILVSWKGVTGKVFIQGAHLVELPCDDDVIEESMPEYLHAPINSADEEQAFKKRNYTAKFQRIPFTGRTEIPKIYQKWQDCKDTRWIGYF